MRGRLSHRREVNRQVEPHIQYHQASHSFVLRLWFMMDTEGLDRSRSSLPEPNWNKKGNMDFMGVKTYASNSGPFL